tara:strand:- start:60 stop:1067 length:1008 start_codon:yes stop_codon:yes gene_type:complete
MSSNVKKILVTGGAGCIGVPVCNELVRRKKEVILYDLSEQIKLTRPYLNKNIKLFSGSIMDKTSLRDAIKECDGVIHLAAHLGVQRTEKNKLRCLEINIEGTKNLLDLIANNKNIKKIVFASSSEVYGEPIKNPIEETDITQGKTLYAVSKLAGEELVKAYQYEYQSFNFCILRYFNTYGPFQVAQFVIPKFIFRVQRNLPPIINGDGSQERSYNFSQDTARATVDALFSYKSNNKILNIGNSSEPINLIDLANLIIKKCGKENKIFPSMNKNFSNTDRKDSREINYRYCDTSLAERILDYKVRTKLEKGIEKVIETNVIPETWNTSEKDYLIDT